MLQAFDRYFNIHDNWYKSKYWRQNVTWEVKYWIAYDDRSWYKDLFCLDINLQPAKPSLNNLGDIGFIYVQNHGNVDLWEQKLR